MPPSLPIPTSQRFRTPVFNRYALTIVLLGTLPLFFLLLRETVVMATWGSPPPALQMLRDCARTFYGAAFPGFFMVLTLAFSHRHLQRGQCFALLGMTLFLLAGCISISRFVPL